MQSVIPNTIEKSKQRPSIDLLKTQSKIQKRKSMFYLPEESE